MTFPIFVVYLAWGRIMIHIIIYCMCVFFDVFVLFLLMLSSNVVGPGFSCRTLFFECFFYHHADRSKRLQRCPEEFDTQRLQASESLSPLFGSGQHSLYSYLVDPAIFP